MSCRLCIISSLFSDNYHLTFVRICINQASCSTTSRCATFFTAISLSIPLQVQEAIDPLPTIETSGLPNEPAVQMTTTPCATAEDHQRCGIPSMAAIGKEPSIASSSQKSNVRDSFIEEDHRNADTSLLDRVLKMQIAISVSPLFLGIPVTTLYCKLQIFILRSLRQCFAVKLSVLFCRIGWGVLSSPSPSKKIA